MVGNSRAATVLGLPAMSAALAEEYTVTDLGALDLPIPQDINEKGDVAGISGSGRPADSRHETAVVFGFGLVRRRVRGAVLGLSAGPDQR